MICTLNRKQQEATLKIVGRLLQTKAVSTPEQILKGVYDIVYESFLNKNMQKEALPYALEMTQYAASNLYLLLQTEDNPIRQIISQIQKTEDSFTQANIEKYTSRVEVLKLLGIRDERLKVIPSTVTEDDVRRHLDNINLKFIPQKERVVFVRGDFPYDEWRLPVAKNSKGETVKLLSVSSFLHNKRSKGQFLGIETLRERAGTLTDMVIRKYFRRPNIDYKVFKDLMMIDSEFTEYFKRFSEHTHDPSEGDLSPTMIRYMSDYLNDMTYVINFIQSNYQDSFVTDLSGLIDQSALSPDEKRKFYIYSAELGLRGELDLIAIKPDGTYTIIDIKSVLESRDKEADDLHKKQVAIYDMIMSEVLGMKSSGHSDIIYLTTTTSNPTRLQSGNKKGGLYKINVPAFDRISTTITDKQSLENDIKIYNMSIDLAFNKVKSVVKTTKEVKPFNPISPIHIASIIRRKQQPPKKDDPLKQIYKSDERISTFESLLEGKAWLHKVFPELKNREVQILRIANSNAGGEFFNDIIKLYMKSNEGVAYHEGWHRFTQLYMTKQEKKDLYNQVKRDNIQFTTRDGRQLSTSTASFLDIEEFMAEEFKKYATNPSSYRFPSGKREVKNWFKRIWEAIKSIARWLMGRKPFSYVELFDNLYTGSYNRNNFSTKNSMFSHLNSFFVSTKTGNETLLDNMTFLRFRDFTDSYLASYMQVVDKTINNYMNDEGIMEMNEEVITKPLIQRKQEVDQTINALKEQQATIEDEARKAEISSNITNLEFWQDALNTILERDIDGKYINIPDYIRAYYATSKFESLRRFVGKNKESVNKIIDIQDFKDFERQEEEGEEIIDKEEDNAPQEDATEYNRSGNEKAAWENAKDILKDFFVGIPRRKSSDPELASSPENYEYDEAGLLVTISKQEGFYKTLRLLQGSLVWEEIQRRLDTASSQMFFPELLTIREKLFGSEYNEGLVTKFNRLGDIMLAGQATAQDIQEHSELMSFLMHFADVMSLRKVPFETFVVKLNYDVEKGDSVRTLPPLFIRENLESIIFSIMNDFTKGFQINMDKEFQQSDRNYVNVYDALYDMMVEGSVNKLFKNKFIYDPRAKKFFFNPLYLQNNFDVKSPTDHHMKNFFGYLGINLNPKIYENKNDRRELLEVFLKLSREILPAFQAHTVEKASEALERTRIVGNLKEWKRLKDEEAAAPEDQKLIIGQSLIDVENKLIGHANRIFSSNPVEQMLFDSKDVKLRSNPRNKIFAANLPIFQRLARIEKNYHKRFSSGSMLVLDKTQFSFFLPNNMLLTEMLINDHVRHVSDFKKYPELSHLDPEKNPQILNSFIFKQLFLPDGNKKSDMKLGVTNLSQMSVIYGEGVVDSKRIQELTDEEKMLFDLLMIRSIGSSEIRRLEASNTAYRISAQRIEGQEVDNIKPVRIEDRYNFSTPSFLAQIRGYIQHAAWKYQYYRNEENRKKDINHQIDNNGHDNLGVFDEMLPKTRDRIKKYIIDNPGDVNSLMLNIEKNDKDLFDAINIEIASYFEAIAISNPNSYKKMFIEKLSDKSRTILSSLSSLVTHQRIMETDSYGNPSDIIFRDVIANDFIMAMEDSLIFFGDYTYYKDPIKRRKIIGNNGSINIIDEMMAKAVRAQREVNSLSIIYQRNKNITLDKNPRLVKKAVIQDVKLTSKYLEKDNEGKMRLIKDLQTLEEQIWGEKVSYEKLAEEKKETIEALTDMEVGDAAALISLDMLRQMRMREMTWDVLQEDEREFRRQQLILKDKLGEPLTQEEREEIQRGPFSSFNVAKFALTGPVYEREHSPFKPTFDKMGLRVLLPSVDWNRTTRPLFEKMLGEGIDYSVMDTGSKVYRPPITKVYSDNALENLLGKNVQLSPVEHAGGFFKHQQNTAPINDKSTLSVQLRSIFYELMVIQKKRGRITTNLKNSYSKVIKSLTDYIIINSSRALNEMGLDIKGKIRDKKTFVGYLQARFAEVDTVDRELIDLLQVEGDDFATYLEALPFQKNIMDLIAGVIDDNFRRIKLNGSKLYQSPEIGTTFEVTKEEKLSTKYRGSIDLRWHELEYDKNGNIISTRPVECKIGFRKQFYPLLNLKHPDGKYIAYYRTDEEGRRYLDKESSLRRLNGALKNPEWVKSNEESVTFIGVRIPLQDINFSSHMIVKEFLPEEVADTIILPPEFYKQTGSDNDIDTVTATFRYLDGRGKVIKRPEENYEDIIDRIGKLESSFNETTHIVNDVNIEDKVNELKQKFIDQNVYVRKNKGIAELEADLTLMETEDGFKIFSGQLNNKSTLANIIKNSEESQLIDELYGLLDSFNSPIKAPKDDTAKELRNLYRKRNNYIKGVTNDIVSSIYSFMETPENFGYLTETDSIEKISELAKQVISMVTGKPVDTIELNKRQSPLTAMSYTMNVVNHNNNFQIRPMLGSFIKTRSNLTLLSQIDTVLNKNYIGGSMMNLLRTEVSPIEVVEMIQKGGTKRSKLYSRHIYTPLLYKKDTSKGIEISVFDEDGGRITKNLSRLSSTLLDLFKNTDTFPSLNITWFNMKTFIFLIVQGVPLERAVMFMNNPVIHEMRKKLSELGTDAKDRHAIIAATQDFSGSDIYPHGGEYKDYERYDVLVSAKDGRLVPNPMLGRPSKAAEKYLAGREIKFNEEEMNAFSEAYYSYMRDEKISAHNKKLSTFLHLRPEFQNLARDIAAYYGTLWEDGDIFYAYFVKGINRNSAKMNSHSAISRAKSVQKARMITNIANPGFEENFRTHTTHSPFFNDEVIENILSNSMPHILDNPDPFFKKEFRAMMERVISRIKGTPEDLRAAEIRLLSDFVEMIYKNFYIFKESMKTGNTLYEYVEYDINPLLLPLVEGSASYRKFLEDFTKQKEALLSEDIKIESLYSDSLLSNQIDIFKAKYPELNEVKMVAELMTRKEPGIDPMRSSNMEVKDVYNMLSQSYITLNLSVNPQEREADETIIRDEWMKLVNFKLSNFPEIYAKVSTNPERLRFYENKTNILEIRRFATLLAYYSLAQSSHVEKSTASFSYLAPPHIIKEVVQSAIDNFNRYLQTAGSLSESPKEEDRRNAITDMLTKFEKMFKQMNGRMSWMNEEGTKRKRSTPEEYDSEYEGTEDYIFSRWTPEEQDIPYRKSHTGKLYSKLLDPNIELFKQKLVKEEERRIKEVMRKELEEMKNTPGVPQSEIDARQKELDNFKFTLSARNNFKIQLSNSEDDFLNCSL